MEAKPANDLAVPPALVPAPREEAPVPALKPLVPSPPPAALLARSRDSSRWRVRLAIIIAAVSLLCVGGGAYFLLAYDKATKPDRSTPAVVVQDYLQAFLVDRDDTDAADFVCADSSGLAAFRQFRDQAISYASARGFTVSFSWGIGDVAQPGNGSAEVAVTLTQSTSSSSGPSGRSIHSWVFETVRQTGWRVCGGTAIS